MLSFSVLRSPRVGAKLLRLIMGPRPNYMRRGITRPYAVSLVFAMLCLRAMVPAGYMLALVDGGLAVVRCDAAATGSSAHHRAGHDHGGHDHTQPDPTCPYAQSAGPAPLPALPALDAVPQAGVAPALTRLSQTRAPLFGPDRQPAPRGPPSSV